MALSGLAEMVCKLSALRGEADMRGVTSTSSVAIDLTQTPDPVGAGFVDSLARPGGNATGFTLSEYGISGKLLEALKEISPNVTRAAVIRDPAIHQGIGLWTAIQTAAPTFGIEVSPVNMRGSADVEDSMHSFAQFPNGGLIVTGSGLVIVHRELIITQAAKHRLPAVYPLRLFVGGGGLLSYGPDIVDQYRRAAGYVDRILKGEKPADLPVQAPTKYELSSTSRRPRHSASKFRRRFSPAPMR